MTIPPNRSPIRDVSVALTIILAAAGLAVGQQPSRTQAQQQGQAQQQQPVQTQEATTVVTTTEPAPKPYDIWSTKYLAGDWGGVRTDLENSGVNLSILFTTEAQANFRGGVNTRNAHDVAGKAVYNLELDFEKMGLVPGGTFFIRGIQTWNSGIRADVGSLTPPYWLTGSSGDRSIELERYWYRQRLFDDRLQFRLGKLLNVVDLFDKNDYAGSYVTQFMNQALNYNLTIPLTVGLGAYAEVWPTDWLCFLAAAQDADAAQSTHTKGTDGWDTAFHDEAHFRGTWEIGLVPTFTGARGAMPAHYRFGWWYNPDRKTVFKDTLGGALATETRSGDVGAYFNFDQLVWKESDDPKDKQGLGLFGRLGIAHRDINRTSHAWTLGASYDGLIPSRDGDTLAFGVAQAILSTQYRDRIDSRADRETVYELYYKIKATPWCEITPDLQLITNPGANKDARDALVGGIRVKIAI